MYATDPVEKKHLAKMMTKSLKNYDLNCLMMSVICIHDRIMPSTGICGKGDTSIEAVYDEEMSREAIQSTREQANKNLRDNLEAFRVRLTFNGKTAHKGWKATYNKVSAKETVTEMLVKHLVMNVKQADQAQYENVNQELNLERFSVHMASACPNFGPYTLPEAYLTPIPNSDLKTGELEDHTLVM